MGALSPAWAAIAMARTPQGGLLNVLHAAGLQGFLVGLQQAFDAGEVVGPGSAGSVMGRLREASGDLGQWTKWLRETPSSAGRGGGDRLSQALVIGLYGPRLCGRRPARLPALTACR